MRHIIVLSLISLLYINTTKAQGLEMRGHHSEGLGVGLSVQHPIIKDGDNISYLSGNYLFDVSLPIFENFVLLTTIPVIHLNYELDLGYFKFEHNRTGIGNIFVGLQSKNPQDESNFYFGVFLPTLDWENAGFGLNTDFSHFPYYFPDLLTIHGSVIRTFNFNPLYFSFEAGPYLAIPTGKLEGNNELFFHFALAPTIRFGRFATSIEFNGIMIATEDIDQFTDRFENALLFGFHFEGDNISAKIFFKKSVTENMNIKMDGVLGIGLKYDTGIW